jgi:hypothetical protein
MQDELLRIIDSEDLPKCYGGTLEWDYEKQPILDEQLSKALGGMANPPTGPWTWKDGKMTLVGTVNGKARSEDAENEQVSEEKVAHEVKQQARPREDGVEI